MTDYIAFCGLDCEQCEARKATVNDDNELRAKVAKEWSKLNGVEITQDMINCGDCTEMTSCSKLSEIISNNPDANLGHCY